MSAACIEAFVLAHENWMEHTVADPELYKFHEGDIVNLHSLESKKEYNGLSGIIKAYMPSRGRYYVSCIGGQPEACANVRPQNLTRVHASAQSRLHYVTSEFLRPGMRYFGSIQIPGDAGYRGDAVIGKRQTYELIIVGPAKEYCPVDIYDDISEALGVAVLARHRAYDDEQFVFVRVAVAAAEEPFSFSMEYSDAETTCRGTWSAESQSLTGFVSQKMYSADQVYIKADPVTHTFTLCPCPDTCLAVEACVLVGSDMCVAHSNQRATAASALRRCLTAFQRLAEMCSPSALSVQTAGGFRWKVLLDAASMFAEQTCAYARLLASFLDALDFLTPAARTDKFKYLVAKGVSRANMHMLCDQCFMTVKYVLTWWYALHPDQVTTAVALQAARYRLDKSYDTFNTALGYASTRLTVDTLCRYATIAAASREGPPDECCVCMDELTCVDMPAASEGGIEAAYTTLVPYAYVTLPCGHAFHTSCIKLWLKFHSQCPMCRVILSEEEDLPQVPPANAAQAEV